MRESKEDYIPAERCRKLKSAGGSEDIQPRKKRLESVGGKSAVMFCRLRKGRPRGARSRDAISEATRRERATLQSPLFILVQRHQHHTTNTNGFNSLYYYIQRCEFRVKRVGYLSVRIIASAIKSKTRFSSIHQQSGFRVPSSLHTHPSTPLQLSPTLQAATTPIPNREFLRRFHTTGDTRHSTRRKQSIWFAKSPEEYLGEEGLEQEDWNRRVAYRPTYEILQSNRK